MLQEWVWGKKMGKEKGSRDSPDTSMVRKGRMKSIPSFKLEV